MAEQQTTVSVTVSTPQIVPAHTQSRTIHLIARYQDHEPREGDPHYHLFLEAKRRIKAAGLYVCAILDGYCAGPLALHHDKVEFAHIDDIDLDKFNKYYGLHLTDAEFQVYVESEGNLEVLCRNHHVSRFGVHDISAADWPMVRVMRARTLPPIEVVVKAGAP